MFWKNYYIVFDLETTGLWSHLNAICEIAIIVLDNDLKEVERYTHYVKTYKGKDNQLLKVEPQALQANGISMKDVEEQGIEASQLHKDLVAIFKKYKVGKYTLPILAGHNIFKFDLNFLIYLFDLFETPSANGNSALYKYIEYAFDTQEFSRIKYGGVEVENYQLGTVCRKHGITLVDAHRALADTVANAKLFKKFVQEIRGGTKTIIETEIKKTKFRDIFKF